MSFPTLDEVMKSTPQLSKTDLDYLQEWMSKQPHLPRLDDIDLVSKMARCQYSLERTKVLLDKYCTIRTHAPEIFKYRKMETIKHQWKFYHISTMGNDARGNRIVCLSFEPEDPSLGFDPVVSSYIAMSFMEVQVRSEPTVPGYVFVTNAQHLSMGHLTKVTVSLLKKLITFIQDATPARIEEVHVINLNSVVDKVMVLIKPLLSREIQNKLYFHSKNLDEFYKKIPKDSLPQEYGGSLRPAKDYYNETMKKVLAHEEWLQTLDSHVVDESRRPGRAQGEGDVFGMEGSFKKLDID